MNTTAPKTDGRFTRVMEFDRKAIGRRIRAARRSREWTCGRLARAIGMSPGGLGALESGACMPSVRVLVAIGFWTRRSLEHLLFGLPKRGSFWK
jgi:transcriptional regulator with XRE-family HTH domain